MEQIQEFIKALETALIFGISLSGLIVLIVQRIKDKWIPEGGAIVVYIAVGLGTVLGSTILFFLFPLQIAPFDYLGVIARIIAAFLWAWTAPFGYDLLKATSASGSKSNVKELCETGMFGNEADD